MVSNNTMYCLSPTAVAVVGTVQQWWTFAWYVVQCERIDCYDDHDDVAVVFCMLVAINHIRSSMVTVQQLLLLIASLLLLMLVVICVGISTDDSITLWMDQMV